MNTILQKVNDSQAVLISELRTEIKQLKKIDASLSDFNFEKLKKEEDDLAREGFDEVIASRPKRTHV